MNTFLKIGLILSLFWSASYAEEAKRVVKSNKKKVKIKYRSRTKFDFSGNRIKGKIKSPAVFYIFQRKRADEHKAIKAPNVFVEHKRQTASILTKKIEGKNKK